MIGPVSFGLQIGFLAVLYLFLFWLAASALRDVAGGRSSAAASDPDATGMHSAVDPLVLSSAGRSAALVVVSAPGHEKGWSYEIGAGAVLGRGEVEIKLDDQFASNRHARIAREGATLVLEDLGSTNGTWLNDDQLQGPTPLHAGDRVRIGDSEFRFEP
jgi:pSer/pThr/pTyr-binding forkhead associated (FHA) protein